MVTKLNIILALMVSLLLSSCMVSFTAAPGSPRTSFPPEMQGKYMATDKKDKKSDTVFLTISENRSESNDKFLNRLIQFTDTTTLSHLGDYYFFNIKSSDSGSTAWYTFPILVKKDALYVFTLPQGKQEKKMAKYVKLVNPANSEYQMDNEPFKNYCEKYLKKKNAIKFIRIK